MKRKIISWIIIILGLCIALYPKASELYGDYRQTKLIEEWQQSLYHIDYGDVADNEEVDNEDTDDEEADSINLSIYSQQEIDVDSEQYNYGLSVEEKKIKLEAINDEKKKKEEEKAAKQREEYIQKHMEGMLIIDKIEFRQPILKGATQNNLNISVASVENTGKAGEIGNYAVAGHRNRSYGRNFNRLEEVETGDTIVVDSGEAQFEYVVTEKLYVYPEEVWVLYSNKKDKEITLITCHPMKNPTHRLIIKGKIPQ